MSVRPRRHPHPRRAVFRWPAAFAVASFAGLLLGLTGDGARDVLSWLLLGSVPAAIIIMPALARSRRQQRSPITIKESVSCTCALQACPCSSSPPFSPSQPVPKFKPIQSPQPVKTSARA